VGILDRLSALDRKFGVGKPHEFDRPIPFWVRLMPATGALVVSGSSLARTGSWHGVAAPIALAFGISLMATALVLFVAGVIWRRRHQRPYRTDLPHSGRHATRRMLRLHDVARTRDSRRKRRA